MDFVNWFWGSSAPQAESSPLAPAPNIPKTPGNPPIHRHQQPSTPEQRRHGRHEQQHQHHKKHKMSPFNGPWSKDIDAFKKSVASIPDKYKGSFKEASKTTLDTICDPSVVHIWESDSDLDSLLQLTSVITMICGLGVRKQKDTKVKESSRSSMLILAEERKGRDNFDRICRLVSYLSEERGKKHLDGTVAVFGGRIFVVRGWDHALSPTGMGNKEAAEKVVKRVNTAVERVFSKDGASKKCKIVWHHGAVLHFLLHWINSTTSALRNALSAITVTGSLCLNDSIGPSEPGKANTSNDLERLEQYARKLDVPVVFLDAGTQLITSEYLHTYMYYFGYYINTLLSSSLTRPHLGKAQDELVTFAFRLRAASEGRYGSDAVSMVQKHLNARVAKPWARHCVDKRSYEKSKCRAAGKETAIHHAVMMADSPFSLFGGSTAHGERSNKGSSIPAFARLTAGPAGTGLSEHFLAAPVEISFKHGRLRPCCPSPLHVVVPAKPLSSSGDKEEAKITSAIQGIMMSMLVCVFQEKGIPILGNTERESWAAVVSACTWALDGCKGKMPESIDEKVEFVKQKLEKGHWAGAVKKGDDAEKEKSGGGGQVGVGGAAVANVGNMGMGMGMGMGGGGFTYPQQQAQLNAQIAQMQGMQGIPQSQHQQQYQMNGAMGNGGNQGMYQTPFGYSYGQGGSTAPGMGFPAPHQQQQPMGMAGLNDGQSVLQRPW